MKFDVFITCAEKDYHKLKYVIKSLDNLDGVDEVVICSPSKIDLDIKQIRDCDVLNFDKNKINYRPNWCFQQFLKLFQQVTKNEYYLTIDADTFINKKLNLFNGDNPIWYVGWEQNNLPYYVYNERMFRFGRVYDHTFLADMNFFNRNKIEHLLIDYNYTIESFFNKSCEIINSNCYPSEADIYGNYCYLKFPNFYEIRKLNTKYYGKSINNGENWAITEIEDLLNKVKDSDLDTFSLHSWC
jgi:hypothetical protein